MMTSNGPRSRDRGHSRSRSPHRASSGEKKRQRSTSPNSSRRSHHDHRRPRALPTIILPFEARPISKHDLFSLRPMFGLYLDIQKRRVLEEMPEEEVRGRWKSFVGKWNRGELAEGWYHPNTLEKALSTPLHEERTSTISRASPTYGNEDDDDDDDFGPALPNGELIGTMGDSSARKHGPSRPNIQDLQVKRELAAERAEDTRRHGIESIRDERRAERNIQKERLEEIAPRAEAGTRERQIEKKRENADSNRAFAASAHDNADAEIKDSDLMGDGGGIDDLKRMKQVEERKRSEREMRREENLAARRAEREERVQLMRQKEEKTMGMLKGLARARFGGGA